jgi:hypothetical protein
VLVNEALKLSQNSKPERKELKNSSIVLPYKARVYEELGMISWRQIILNGFDGRGPEVISSLSR